MLGDKLINFLSSKYPFKNKDLKMYINHCKSYQKGV